MGGSVSGSLWGFVLGGVGLGVVSLVNEQPGGNAMPAAVPELTTPEVLETTAESLTGLTSEDSDVAVVISQVAEPEITSDAPQVDTAPIAAPQTPELSALLEVPETVSDLAPRETTQDLASQSVVSQAPRAPAPDAKANIETGSAQAPDISDVSTDTVLSQAANVSDETGQDAMTALTEAPDIQPEAPAEMETAVDPVPPVIVTQSPPIDVPVDGISTDIAVVVPEVASAVPEVASAVPEVASAVPEVASAVPEVASAVPEVAPVVPEVAPVVPDVIAEAREAPVVVSEPATTVVPAPDTTASETGPVVRVNRPSSTPSQTAGRESEVVEADAFADNTPALVRYATAFDAEPGLPLIAIVMLDAGDTQTAPADIAALPMPVTVVIDALRSDAAAKMMIYRAAGVEVMLQASLPSGAMPTDVEVAYEAAFAILPETVALFSDGTGVLQGNRELAEQVIDVLGAEGRGLVVIERGLSSSLRIAERAGLPAVAVLRDLDGAGQSGAAVTRALDQAAFRARQSGNAVLLSRVSPETLAVLQEWGAENDGDQIALAPVSAILQNAVDTK